MKLKPTGDKRCTVELDMHSVTHSEHGRSEQTPGEELQEDHYHRVVHTGSADALLGLRQTHAL